MLRLYDYTCKYCGKAFQSRHRNRKYCCTRCAYDDRIGQPRHPNSGKKRTKKPTRFICQYCNEPFERMVYPANPTRYFCSPACRNKARKLKEKPCPVCGKLFSPQIVDTGGVRRQHCSPECASFARRRIPSPKRTIKEIRETIAEIYPTQGAEPLMEMFGITKGAVQQIAYDEGVKLDPDVYYEHVHEAAREHMTNNNPMHDPECVEKVQDYYRKHPKQWERRLTRIMEGHRRIQKGNPTKLELQLFEYLDDLDVDYEPFYLIKPKFIVDVRVGDLIIQADGDYWHGHPSRVPLTRRQKAQQKRDKAQDKYLTTCGYTVVRIWESDMSKDTVVSVLKEHNII